MCYLSNLTCPQGQKDRTKTGQMNENRSHKQKKRPVYQVEKDMNH